MSIASFSELKSSIGRWLHRSDLAAVAPDLITLAETRFNRNLRVRQMETHLSQSVSVQTVALPADWLEFIGAPTADGYPLDFVTRDQYKTYVRGRYNGNFYSIFGSNLMLGYQIVAPVDLEFDYYAKIPALSDAQPANWLLNEGVDVYLYGALIEAEPYMKNDTRIPTWQGLLQVALNDLQTSSDKAKYSGASLVMEPPR